jgi:hypothetical protein
MKKYHSIDAYITVRFRANNLIDEDALQEEYDGDIGAWVRELIESEHIIGVVEDNYEIVSIERVPDEATA